MLVFLDEQGRIQWGNREWTRTLGYDIAEARGERDILADLYPDPRQQRRLRDSIGAPVGQWTDFRPRTRHGTVLDTIWANAPLTGGGWLAIGWTCRSGGGPRSATARSSRRARKASHDWRSTRRCRCSCLRKTRSIACTAARALRECNDAMARMYGFKEAGELVGHGSPSCTT